VPRSTKLLVARVRQLYDRMPKVVLTRHMCSSYFLFIGLLHFACSLHRYSVLVCVLCYSVCSFTQSPHLIVFLFLYSLWIHSLSFLLLIVISFSHSLSYVLLSVLLPLTVCSFSPLTSQVVMPILESIEGVSGCFLEIIEKT
jgi:hypothetical protein